MLRLGLIFSFALMISACSSDSEYLRYAHPGIEGEIQSRYPAEVASEIEAATDGAVTIQVYPASQLGNVSEMVDGVRMGTIQIAHHDFASLTSMVPEIAVFNAPFIYRDGAHALAATDPTSSPAMMAINERLVEQGGVRIIGRIYRGARHITSNYEIRSPDDMEGKFFRAVPLDIWISMVKGFGAVPTPVEIPELPTALMTGLVVGQENPLTLLYTNKIYEVQSHVAMTGHMQSVVAVFINESTWQGLTEEQRATMTRILDNKAEESLRWAQESEASLIARLKDEGMTFMTEDNGLDVEAFRTRVLAQINSDFPEYGPFIEQIMAVE